MVMKNHRRKIETEMKALLEPMDKALEVVFEEAYRKYREELEAVEDEPTVLVLRWAIYKKTTACKQYYALYAQWFKLFNEWMPRNEAGQP